MDRPHLVIAIRGWTDTGDRLLFGRPGGEIPPAAVAALEAAMPDSRVWAPALSLPMFSMEDPEDIAARLFAQIDRQLRDWPQVQTITLMGYSAGSLLARRIFCLAHGADRAGEPGPPPAPWAHRLQRVVMLAGITRGWEFSTASPDHVRFLAPVLYGIARLVGFLKGLGRPEGARKPFIWRLLRGSPFVVSTRIQYVKVIERLRRSAADAAGPVGLRAGTIPSTVFLLGARDEYISPADCTELGPRGEFAFIELPGANHTEALLIADDGDLDEAQRESRRQRRDRLVAALSRPFAELQSEAWVLPPGDIDDYLDPMDLTRDGAATGEAAATVQHAVMVIHGIRDNGFWTKRVAREIKTLARRLQLEVRAPTPSYGYFSMWDFVKPGGRERAARWFMERYADVQSHFPNARISFVGHSNGTYIAARALQLCPAIRLHRVVFAGSVVRCGYDWTQLQGQAGAVLNYVGNADSVVAFLPAVFERLHLRAMDVGGAGAYGFEQAREPVRSSLPMPLHELRFVAGGHGAAIAEGYWPEIAGFVLDDRVPQRAPVPRSNGTERIYRWAPALTAAGAVVAIGLLTAPITAAAWATLATSDLGTSALAVLAVAAAVLGGLALSWLAGRFLRAW